MDTTRFFCFSWPVFSSKYYITIHRFIFQMLDATLSKDAAIDAASGIYRKMHNSLISQKSRVSCKVGWVQETVVVHQHNRQVNKRLNYVKVFLCMVCTYVFNKKNLNTHIHGRISCNPIYVYTPDSRVFFVFHTLLFAVTSALALKSCMFLSRLHIQ